MRKRIALFGGALFAAGMMFAGAPVELENPGFHQTDGRAVLLDGRHIPTGMRRRLGTTAPEAWCGNVRRSPYSKEADRVSA